VWAGRAARSTYLTIYFSADYLRRQNIAVRVLYYLRAYLRRAHVTVSFSGCTTDAVQAVDAITLRHHTGHVSIPNIHVDPPPNLFWCNLISLLCPAMLLYRVFTQEIIEATDYLPYVIVFLLCRLYAIGKSTLFAKPAVS
jgi:hypothetical protein